MLLTCPTCRSGLQVPDGTAAHVRCPSCSTVFAPADGVAPEPVLPPPPPPPPPPHRPAPPPPVRQTPPRPRRAVLLPAEDARPRRERRGVEEDHPDDAPRRRREPNDGLTQAERDARAAAFQRAAWGCKLIALSLALYAASMLLICVFFIRLAISRDVDAGLITGAGVLGLINWVVGAVGVGLCLSGYPSPGHWRFGITAAVVVLIHGVMLFAVVNRGESAAEFLRTGGSPAESGAGALAQLPTKLDALTLYMAWLAYPDQLHAPGSAIALSMLTGVAEMVRLACVMLLLSCLARAAGDADVVHQCVRAGGIVCFVPGAMAFALLAIGAFMIETNAQSSTFGLVVSHMVVMGVYALFAGMILKPLMAARDTAEACEYPYQSKLVELGG